MVNTPLVVCHFLPILWSKKTTPMSLSLSAATVRGCHTYLQHWRVKWAFVGTQPLYYFPVLGAQELQEKSLFLGKVCSLSQHRLCSCEQGPSKAFLMLGQSLKQEVLQTAHTKHPWDVLRQSKPHCCIIEQLLQILLSRPSNFKCSNNFAKFCRNAILISHRYLKLICMYFWKTKSNCCLEITGSIEGWNRTVQAVTEFTNLFQNCVFLQASERQTWSLGISQASSNSENTTSWKDANTSVAGSRFEQNTELQAGS